MIPWEGLCTNWQHKWESSNRGVLDWFALIVSWGNWQSNETSYRTNYQVCAISIERNYCLAH